MLASRITCAFLLSVTLVSAQELTESTLPAIRDEVLPSEEERAWMKIGWHPTIWSAVLEARRLDKPVLLYAMNGHPMACT